jgi:hypothetical protein
VLVEEARQVLDRFDVPNRLEHVRRYVWRDGTLRFQIDQHPLRPSTVYYQLEAYWPTMILAPLPGGPDGLEHTRTPVVEGRWVRGTTGYVLRVGIDLAVPSAIYIRSRALQSFVPFVGRPADQVEHALQNDLTAYVNVFLSTCRPVPEARAADAKRVDKHPRAD